MKPVIEVLATIVLIGACADAGQMLEPGASYLRAEVSGAVEEEHDGDATYASRYHLRHERDLFSVASWDTTGPRARWMSFMAFGSLELPDRVPVELEAIDPHYPAENGETVVYFRGDEWYISHEGTWTVEYLDDDLIRGTFEFRAFRYCIRGEVESCAVPDAVPDNPVWLEVRGEFLADDPEGVLLNGAEVGEW